MLCSCCWSHRLSSNHWCCSLPGSACQYASTILTFCTCRKLWDVDSNWPSSSLYLTSCLIRLVFLVGFHLHFHQPMLGLEVASLQGRKMAASSPSDQVQYWKETHRAQHLGTPCFHYLSLGKWSEVVNLFDLHSPCCTSFTPISLTTQTHLLDSKSCTVLALPYRTSQNVWFFVVGLDASLRSWPHCFPRRRILLCPPRWVVSFLRQWRTKACSVRELLCRWRAPQR